MPIRSLLLVTFGQYLSLVKRPSCYRKCISWQGKRRHYSSLASTNPTKLDFVAIDAKWQKRWAQRHKESADKVRDGVDETKTREKFYVLPMFPYPSGMLHMGHLRVYTIADVIARFRRMCGFQVLHPMGWDAFGLPAENAAIENGIDPALWTDRNIQRMKKQLIAMNGNWDWNKELRTCEPSFYKQTQRIFLALYDRGLAYQADSEVNFDPQENTVLANEQVDSHGRSWRSGAIVEKRRLKQWFLKLTDYKDALLDDLQLLKGQWPDRVLSMQNNWLGKSIGTTLRFNLVQAGTAGSIAKVDVFTTRVDTLYGVQYIALSLQHPLVIKAAESSPALSDFLKKAIQLEPDSKEGFLIEGLMAWNPLALVLQQSGDFEKSIPIFTAPYVVNDYGTGATMGVPAHDERDFAFWTHNCVARPVRQVIKATKNESMLQGATTMKKPFISKGILTENCGIFGGLGSDEASKRITSALQEAGQYIRSTSNWRIRDWLISRQRYWGTPIPIVHCKKCGPVPVSKDKLPVLLPKLKPDDFTSRSGGSLESLQSWAKTICPQCGGFARRETDTMDTFMDSSWYYFRFANVACDRLPFSRESADSFLPVDVYVGGIEHAILHLLYARFMSKFLCKAGFWPNGEAQAIRGEPFKQLICQGMVHGRTYSDPESGKVLTGEQVSITPSGGIVIATGKKAKMTSEKMSKSKHNGVDPGDCISSFGADATRAHVIFQAPVTEVLEWDSESIVGIQRWLYKVWNLVNKAKHVPDDNRFLVKRLSASYLSDAESKLWLETQRKVGSITSSYLSVNSMNTVVSDLMKLSNNILATSDHGLLNQSPTYYQSVDILLRLMAPIVPAFAEECWATLHSVPSQESSLAYKANNDHSHDSIFDQKFPVADISDALQHVDKQTSAIQINGRTKFISRIDILPKELLMHDTFAEKELRVWLTGQLLPTIDSKRYLGENGEKIRDAKRVIVVKGGRTINFVL